MKVVLVLIFFTSLGFLKAQDRKSTALPNVSIVEQSFEMPGLNRERGIRLYLPPSYDKSDQRYPVIYMHDGQNLFDDATSFVGEWGVDEILNEIASEGGPEFIVVGIDNGGTKRTEELTPYANKKYGGGQGQLYMDFIVRVVKPFVDAHYRTLPDAENTGLIGSSLGGLISHYGIYTHPNIFSKAGVFSPSYWFCFDEMKKLTIEHPLPPDHRMVMLVGKKEGEIMNEPFKEMMNLLSVNENQQMNIYGIIVEDGEHNEKLWRSELKEAVLSLFQEK